MKTEGAAKHRQAEAGWKIGIVHSDFYKEEMQTMVNVTVTALRECGVSSENISVYPVPGALEVPLIGRRLTEHKAVHALIGLGIIVEGETHHARLVAENAARGMMDIQTKYGMPFINEVLYVDTLELAQARLYKGKNAAHAAIDSLALLAQLQS